MKTHSRKTVFALGVLALLGACLCAGMANAESVKIAPFKIVLNAQGNSDDVQAIIGMVLPSANIVAFDATLSLDDGCVVLAAESAFYCAIDDNLIVGFDRTELQEAVQDLAGQTVVATVAGSVTVEYVNGDGELVAHTRKFDGSDDLEIVAPGNKK